MPLQHIPPHLHRWLLPKRARQHLVGNELGQAAACSTAPHFTLDYWPDSPCSLSSAHCSCSRSQAFPKHYKQAPACADHCCGVLVGWAVQSESCCAWFCHPMCGLLLLPLGACSILKTLQVLVGWTNMSQVLPRIVLSFRGTASMQNLLSDFQVQ